MFTKTYWNHEGKYSCDINMPATLLKELTGYLSGLERTNRPAVNRLRRAFRTYYEANNNGCYQSFYGTFGVGGRAYFMAVSSENPDQNMLDVIAAVESKLDRLIEDAHEEIYG